MGEDKEYYFLLPNGHDASLICNDAEKCQEGTTFVILSGGYETKVKAWETARNLKDSVLCFGTKFRMGVDVGKDVASGFLGQVVKDEIFKEHGVKVIDDVHGISVYSEEFPVTSSTISSTSLLNPRDPKFFSDEVCRVMDRKKNINDKIKLSMELLSSSYFESSTKSRFLSLILAAESLLDPENRTKPVRELVDALKDKTRSSSLTEEEINSIIGTLNWLYKDSISLSLKKMANKYLSGKLYDGLSSDKFIGKCYTARSKLVHNGDVSNPKYNIGTLAANLEVYMKDILVEMSGI